MLKLAICDDDAEALSHIVSLVEAYRAHHSPDYEYTAFSDGFALMSALEKGSVFDIYCLDIIMPGFMGIDLAKEIRALDKNAQIIFFSSTREFALESYSVKAANYVLKPITEEKLFSTLTDALEQVKKKQEAFIVVKSSSGIQKILLSNLVYAEAMGKKVICHISPDKTITCTEQFHTVCSQLERQGHFIKPHRSYLVNMSYIDSIDRTKMTLQTEDTIPIAQGKSKEIRERYLAYQMEE